VQIQRWLAYGQYGPVKLLRPMVAAAQLSPVYQPFRLNLNSMQPRHLAVAAKATANAAKFRNMTLTT
jgi:hypothetical protein